MEFIDGTLLVFELEVGNNLRKMGLLLMNSDLSAYYRGYFLVLWGRRDAGTTEGTQMTAFGWVGLRLRVILFFYLLSFLSFPFNAEQSL
jgi:hypothetical protein